MLQDAIDRTPRSHRMTPTGSWCPRPPIGVISQIHGAPGPVKYQGAGNQIFRRRAGIICGVQRAFRDREVACLLHEARKTFVGDKVSIHPETIDRHLVDRGFLGVEIVRTHEKGSTRNPKHIRRRLDPCHLLKHLVGHPSPRVRVIDAVQQILR